MNFTFPLPGLLEVRCSGLSSPWAGAGGAWFQNWTGHLSALPAPSPSCDRDCSSGASAWARQAARCTLGICYLPESSWQPREMGTVTVISTKMRPVRWRGWPIRLSSSRASSGQRPLRSQSLLASPQPHIPFAPPQIHHP